MNNPKTPSATAEKKTIVEEGTELKGSIDASCAVVVQGSVEGQVNSPSVEISATGRLAGKTTTGTLTSSGHVSGEIDVDSARLAGTVAPKTVIRASKLDVKLAHPTAKIELRFGPGGRSFS